MFTGDWKGWWRSLGFDVSATGSSTLDVSVKRGARHPPVTGLVQNGLSRKRKAKAEAEAEEELGAESGAESGTEAEAGAETEAGSGTAAEAAGAQAGEASDIKKRPRGRAPQGKTWNTQTGRWVEETEAEAGAETEAEAVGAKAGTEAQAAGAEAGAEAEAVGAEAGTEAEAGAETETGSGTAMEAAGTRVEDVEALINVITLAVADVDDDRQRELKTFVENWVDVPQGKEDGPCGQINTRMGDGFKQKNGWLVYARARETEPSKVVEDRELPRVVKDSVVGALLVTGSVKEWRVSSNGVRPRGGAHVTVDVLATHKTFEGRGVATAMWGALMKQLSIDGESYGQTLNLIVNGGSCLNTDKKQNFYEKRGFVVNKEGEGLNATAIYVNGKPTLQKINDERRRNGGGKKESKSVYHPRASPLHER